MSGHSKWSKVKHQKEAVDKAKGQIFTKLSRNITLAVREGGGNTDVATNFKLKVAVTNARSNNMPKEKIQTAIDKGAKTQGVEGNFQEFVYEAIMAGKIGLLITTLTDNKQRTVSDIKHILDKYNSILVSNGAVVYLFDYLGMISFERNPDEKSGEKIENDICESSALDYYLEANEFILFTEVGKLAEMTENFLEKGYTLKVSQPVFKPKLLLDLDKEEASRVNELINTLENLDDVQKVYSNSGHTL